MIFVLTIGSLCWSSSWWWWPHISGSEIFGPLLRAGLVDLDQFFAKCKFWICWQAVKKNRCTFYRCFCPPNWPFLLGVGPFSNIEGLPSPSILARAPQFWQKPPLSTASKMLSQARSPRSSHSPAPQFWQKPLNFGKVVVPQKNGQFWGGEIFLCTPKKKWC